MLVASTPLVIAAIYESVCYTKKEGGQALPCIGYLQNTISFSYLIFNILEWEFTGLKVYILLSISYSKNTRESTNK